MLCIVFMQLSALRVADAQPATPPDQPTWAVDIAAGSICAGDAVFRERLSASIPERQRAPLEQAELRARVSVGRDQTATLSVFDQLTQQEAGQRQITLPRGGCKEAADALAFVIAVMVEAGRSPLPPSPAAEPAEVPPPPPEPAKEAKAEAEDAETPAYKRPERYAWQGPPLGHDLSAQVGIGLGLLPGDSLGANVGWGMRGSRIWPVWIEATGWFEQPSDDLRAEVGAAYALLSICPLYLKNRAIRGRLCPGVAAGALWASGQHLPDAQKSVSFLTLASLAAAAHIRIFGPLELVLSARMEVPFKRITFAYYSADGTTPEIHQTAVITGSFFGGLGLCFR
jgi:hypothetical protein